MIICKDRFQREGIPQKIMCSLFAGDAIIRRNYDNITDKT